jgi:GTP-binding protein
LKRRLPVPEAPSIDGLSASSRDRDRAAKDRREATVFIDEAFIVVRSGAGGKGCVSFRREKFIPRGGPDGGDGGDGGDVIIEADPQLSTLVDVARRSIYAAPSGRPGSGGVCSGRRGQDLVLDVPVGTIVRVAPEEGDPRRGPLLADLSQAGQRVAVARGGRGGRGNKAFATAVNQAPRTAEDGGPAVEHRLYLELKLLADVGLVGLPNAGKSTLLSRISAATPKIAAYPFTTLHPVLGIVELGDWRRLVVADIPGLIEGAHAGHGLGTEFLRHVERTRVLVHLISVEHPSVDALVRDCRTIEAELASFSESLARKPRLLVLSKGDLLAPEALRELVSGFSSAIGLPALGISAATGSGLSELLLAVDRSVASAAGRPE